MPGTPSRHVDRRLAFVVGVVIAAVLAGCSAGTPSAAPVTLRLQVGLTPEELATFQPAITALDAAHPEWVIALENVPQASEVEKVTSQLAADDMPDLLRLQGSNVQQWIRRDAFVDLDRKHQGCGAGPRRLLRRARSTSSAGTTACGVSPIPPRRRSSSSIAPAFAAAGLAPPTDAWTFDDMRTAAIALTVDGAGRHPGDAGFDPATITRWGWNGGVTYYWQDALIQGRGGELCATDDCTTMSFTGAANQAAFDWWVSLVKDDHAALYDPYGGSQTGVPGDPFISGKAAMGSNGSFAIGQLNAGGTIDYDIVPPFLGTDGSAAHAAEHQRLRHRRPRQAPDRGLGAPPGPHRPGLPGLDLGQARSCRAGSTVRGVVGHRHLAPAGEPEGDPRGDGGRRRSSARTPPARGTPTAGRSTCSRR